jgi:probable rRNA maturation factor
MRFIHANEFSPSLQRLEGACNLKSRDELLKPARDLASPGKNMEPRQSESSVLSSRYTIDVSDTQSFLVVDAQALASLARRVLEREGVEQASLSLALVDNATIEVLNRRHLGHAWPTDVLSFALNEPGEGALAAELVISAEMAQATAAEAGGDPTAELALYVVHGLLHLCGYDDHAPADVDRMRRREAEHMAAAGLSYISPVATTAEPADAGGERSQWSG